ncbi:hypothetical protein VKT23_006938 [Stygiomarasmius scandens]|uniref:Uncharacterized protein n=1 Tax=Marasmiellus scandens TaxID=2682957 RepID=A0ABR1JP44_9AGAR
MSFTKVSEDIWHCDPASVTSTLSFQISDSSGSANSPCCGMGWQFCVSSNSKEGATQHKATITRLSFDPQGFIRLLSPRNLKISVRADPGIAIPNNYIIPSLDESSSSNLELGTYSHSENQTVTFQITIYFPEGFKLDFPPRLPRAAPSNVVDVIYDSVKGKKAIDCVFYLYSASARGGKGQISKPRAVYANLALLRGHCDYLDALLGDGFQEASTVDPAQIPPVSWGYDYDSDSDFEEDLDDDFLEKQVENKKSASTQNGTKSTSDADTCADVSTPTMEVPKENSSFAKCSQQFSRSMVLTGFAFRTWRALILYLSTKRITFRKLSSQPHDLQYLFEFDNEDACSPKSMYRLADMIGLDDLKQKAYSAIKMSISRYNVVEEVVSLFSSRYDGVREFEINHLLECDKKEFENFCQKLSRGEFVDHQLSAVAEILMALKRVAPVSSLGSSPEPAPAPPAESPFADATPKRNAKGGKKNSWGAF